MRRLARHRIGLLAAAIIILIEITLGNMPFWTSLGTPTPTAVNNAHVTLGDGLVESGDGVLRVVDPTAAYIDVTVNDQPVRYIRYDFGGGSPRKADIRGKEAKFSWNPRIRLDAGSGADTGSNADAADAGTSNAVDWHTGRVVGVSHGVKATHVIRNRAYDGDVVRLRLWIQESYDTQFAFHRIVVNAHPTFRISPVRVLVMAAVAAILIALRPRSRLYSMTLDTRDRRQRLSLVTAVVPFLIAFGFTIWSGINQGPQVFHRPFAYTYDMDQYARLGDALLHGRPWLDLPVPQAIMNAADPYDVAFHERLLATGTNEVYWDHAYFNGHWYSYFGVVPALLLFVPFQAITSLWVDGGAWLPASVATVAFLIGFLVFGLLLVVRLFTRFFPTVSVGSTVLAMITFACGSNAWVLWMRPSFYEIPTASALMFTMMGLWFWLGARRGGGADDGNGGYRLSRAHIAAGSLCMALTLGCRMTFIFCALFFLPVFADEIRSGLVLRPIGMLLPRRWRMGVWKTQARGHRLPPHVFASWRNDLAALLPAVAVFAGLLWYNLWRFGSLLDFGNDYQFTVVDLTRYREPLVVLPQIVGYYLFQPPRLTGTFPWLTVPYTPVTPWQYHERIIGGLFWMIPVCLLVFLMPPMRHALRRHRAWGLACTSVMLGVFELLFVSYKGGMDWRYACDFSWLFTLPGILMIPIMMEWARTRMMLTSVGITRTARTARAAVIVLVLWTLFMTVASSFMTGRASPLISSNPVVFYTVQSWFVW
ncbi:glycosyltransferase [Bifidobacterium callimiconis]|uniref:Glycosyltransferase n=1 Tax=Bifidobacterium callimiconis TaxID=2306973 RepID=A0A430FGJ4_9BIFI|nr:glycosyltransferase [Bifidobacterium callimiconis]